MKAIEIQKQMNAMYARRNHSTLKVYALYIKMNAARAEEGIEVLILYSLEKTYNSIKAN